MTLRIQSKPGFAEEPGDTWATRLAKLIPGEALALYGSGQTIVPDTQPGGLWVLAGGCLILIGIVRWKGTQVSHSGAQVTAILIAMVSFGLWIMALQPPAGPVDLGDNAWLAALMALLWATIIPLIYKGEGNQPQ